MVVQSVRAAWGSAGNRVLIRSGGGTKVAAAAADLRGWSDSERRSLIIGGDPDPDGPYVMLLPLSHQGGAGFVYYGGHPEWRKSALSIAAVVKRAGSRARPKRRSGEWPDVVRPMSDLDDRDERAQAEIARRAAVWGAASGAVTGFAGGIGARLF